MADKGTSVTDLVSKIGKAEKMPAPRRGRKPIDLTPLAKQISDFEGHTISPINDNRERDKYSRWIRNAAKQANLDVVITYVEEEKSLYFQGYTLGSAPARGRRATPKVTTPKKVKAESKEKVEATEETTVAV